MSVGGGINTGGGGGGSNNWNPKVVQFDDYILYKADGNVASVPEDGDWREAVNADGTFSTSYYDGAGWVDKGVYHNP